MRLEVASMSLDPIVERTFGTGERDGYIMAADKHIRNHLHSVECVPTWCSRTILKQYLKVMDDDDKVLALITLRGLTHMTENKCK